MEKKWNCFKESVHEATKECTEKVQRKKHKEWMTDEILKMMEERRDLKNSASSTVEEYNQKDKEIKKACLQAKEAWFNEKCDEILRLDKCSNSKELHSKVKQVTGSKKKSAGIQACVKDKNGNILFEKEKIEERWTEY